MKKPSQKDKFNLNVDTFLLEVLPSTYWVPTQFMAM